MNEKEKTDLNLQQSQIVGTTIYDKLAYIQAELKAPKNQFNSFGNYKYRNLDDICTAVKPLLKQTNTILLLQDDLILIGERYYVKSTATLQYNGQVITCAAFAREDAVKKGMDVAQVTGSASSYARKYAVNGLFILDDSQDPDTQDNRTVKIEYITDEQIDELKALEVNVDTFVAWCKAEDLKHVLKSQAQKVIDKKNGKKEGK